MKRFLAGAIAALVLMLGLSAAPARADKPTLPVKFRIYRSDTFPWSWDANGNLTVTGALTIDMSSSSFTADDLTAVDDLIAGDDVKAGDELYLDFGGSGTVAKLYASGVAGNQTVKVDAGSNAFAVYVASSPVSAGSVKQFEVTSTTARIIIPPTSSPSMTSSTSAGLLWLTNGTPDDGKTAHKSYQFINGSWTLLN